MQVKVTSPVDVEGLSLTRDVPPNVRTYRSACLIIWHDENTFVRLERASSYTTERFWFYKAYLGGELAFAKHGIVQPDAASHLRIQRKQGTLYAWYRQEGDREWTAMEIHRLGLPDEVQVGVSLINTTSEPFTVRFEDFVMEQD